MFSKYRKWWMVVATVAASVLALSGCSGGSPGAGGKVTINFVGPETPATFAPIISAFEKKNPDIKVKYSSVPFDQLNSTLQARLSAKDSSIDVYTADQSRIPSLAARGFLLDLSDLQGEAKRKDLSSTIEPSSYNGKLYSLPVWTSSQFLYYNKDLLAKAGVTPPSKDPGQRWTWEQVKHAAMKAQAAGAKYGILLEQVERYYQLQPLPESLGGGSGLTGKDLLTPDLANPGWIKAMNFYHDLFADGVSPRGVASDQANPLFVAGKSAFFVGQPSAMSPIAAAKLHFGIAPHPYFAGGKAVTPTDSWSWGVSPFSTKQDAAKKFIEFASLDRAGSEASIKKNFMIPANAAAFKNYKKEMDAIDPPASTGAADLLEYELRNTAIHRPRSIGYVQFEDAMLKVFSDIRNGADPKARLTQANAEVAQAMSNLK